MALMKPSEFAKRIGDGPWMHLLTSYKPDNVWEVDHEAMRLNLRYMIENGAKVVDCGGTAGEWGFVTDEERMESYRDLVEVGKGKILCVAGNGHSSTKKAVEVTKAAEKLGVDGFMTIGPFYTTPDAEGLYQHFKAIAEATSLGVLVYNSSALTHRANISPAVMERLAKIPNIVGIKECGRDMDQWLAQIRLMERYHKIVVCGMEEMYYVAGALLSDAVVSCTTATATWDPAGPIALFDAVKSRDFNAITRWFRESSFPYEEFKQRAGPGRNQSALKAGLDMVEGVRGGAVRLPAMPLKDAEQQELRDILSKKGLKLRGSGKEGEAR